METEEEGDINELTTVGPTNVAVIAISSDLIDVTCTLFRYYLNVFGTIQVALAYGSHVVEVVFVMDHEKQEAAIKKHCYVHAHEVKRTSVNSISEKRS